jgi:hypothetical protein
MLKIGTWIFGSDHQPVAYELSQTPEQRLSALVALRRDIMQVEKARLQNKKAVEDG